MHMKVCSTLLAVFDEFAGLNGTQSVWDTGRAQRPCTSALFGDGVVFRYCQLKKAKIVAAER